MRELRPYDGALATLIGNAVRFKKLTRTQANSLLRHRKHHTEGHLLYMIRLMIEKGMSFQDAHERAMREVGK